MFNKAAPLSFVYSVCRYVILQCFAVFNSGFEQVIRLQILIILLGIVNLCFLGGFEGR